MPPPSPAALQGTREGLRGRMYPVVRRAGEGSASSGAAGRRFTVSGPRTAGPSGRQHGQWRVSTEYIPRWSV